MEALIATVGKPYPWLRGFVGDVLAVGWVYLVFRSFIRAGALPLAAAALLTGYAVEFGQYLAKLYGWQIKQPLLRILLGSVPDWWDVLAYTVGFFLVLALAGWRRRGGRARRRLVACMPAAVFAGLHTAQHQHRQLGLRQHALGFAAQQEAGHAVASMRAHDDEIAALRLGGVDDGGMRVVVDRHQAGAGHQRTAGLRLQPVQVGLRVLARLVGGSPGRCLASRPGRPAGGLREWRAAR